MTYIPFCDGLLGLQKILEDKSKFEDDNLFIEFDSYVGSKYNMRISLIGENSFVVWSEKIIPGMDFPLESYDTFENGEHIIRYLDTIYCHNLEMEF